MEIAYGKEMTVKDWIFTLIIAGLPVAGFIMMIIWAVDKEPSSRKNWAQASIWLSVISIVLTGIVLLFVYGTSSFLA